MLNYPNRPYSSTAQIHATPQLALLIYIGSLQHGGGAGPGRLPSWEEIMGSGSVYRRCGCRYEGSGRLLGAWCPSLALPGHGSWYFSIGLPSAAGERRRVRRGGFSSRKAAAAALEELCSARGGPGAGLLTGEWLGSRVSLRPSTARSYETHIRCYLVPYLGDIPLAWLTAGMCRRCSPRWPRNEAALGTPARESGPFPEEAVPARCAAVHKRRTRERGSPDCRAARPARCCTFASGGTRTGPPATRGPLRRQR